MAITRVGTPVGYDGDTQNTNHNFDHDVHADADFVLCPIGFRANRNISAASIQSESMTALASAVLAGADIVQHSHYRVAPSVGTARAVALSLNSNTSGFPRPFGSSIVGYDGVDPADPVGTVLTDTGDQTSVDGSDQIHFNVASSPGDLVIGILYIRRVGSAAVVSPAVSVFSEAQTSADASTSNQSRLVVAQADAGGGATTTISFTLSDAGNAREWAFIGFALQPATTGPTPAVISRKAVVIGDDPRNDDVTAVAEIDSVDGTADHHDSYGHTSDLGSDPATWVASATVINAPQNPANDIAWGGRSPNTSYWIALISDDGAGGLSISNRLEIVTAPARATGVSATSVESDSIRVQGTDATGGAFEHRYLRRLTASGGYSEVAVSPAGDPVDHTFDNLDPSTEYGLAVITTDLTEPARISAVVEVIETTLPDVTYEIKIELDPSEIDFPEEESVEQPLPVQYAVFNSPNPSQWLSPAFFGTSEIDVDGVFTLDVTGTLVADDIVFVYLTSLTEDQVTAWEANTEDLSLVEHRHHGGPAVVTVVELES